MSQSTSADLREIEQRLARLEAAVEGVEEAHRDEETLRDRAAGLRRAFNSLRQEQRELRELVTEQVVGYLDDQRQVLTRLQERVSEYGEIRREIQRNRDMIESVNRQSGERDEDLRERVSRLETRVNAIARQLD